MASQAYVNGVTLSDATEFNRFDSTSYAVLGTVAGTNTVTAAGPANYSYAATTPPVWFIPAVTNTAATTINVTPSGGSALGAKNIFSGGVSLRGGELVAGIPVAIIYDGTQFNIVASGVSAPMVDPKVFDGRLTLETGVPVSTTDQTAKETIYLTPYKGNKIALYTGATWKLYTFAEISGDVPDATQMNDAFVYDNAGTLTLDIVAWTNDTTRATALTTQDGVYVKTGATGRRYVGSFYGTTAGNGQTEDSVAKRYVWNYYNRAERPMHVLEATDTWTHTTTFHQANASAANQLDYVQGVLEEPVEAEVTGMFTSDQASNSINAGVGIGIDSSTVSSAQIMDRINNIASQRLILRAKYRGWPGIGKRTLRWLEQSDALGTTTWFGDNGAATICQTGIVGRVRG